MADEYTGSRRPPLRYVEQVLAYAFIQVQDVASILDVSEALVRKFIALDRLKVVKVGRAIRIPQDEALRFFATLGVHIERT